LALKSAAGSIFRAFSLDLALLPYIAYHYFNVNQGGMGVLMGEFSLLCKIIGRITVLITAYSNHRA
jgi:hypothetical protein